MTGDRESGVTNTRRRRLAVLVGVVVLAVFGGFVYQVARGGREEGEVESLCEGRLSVEDVSRLGGGAEGSYDSSFKEIRKDLSGYHPGASSQDGMISRCGIWSDMRNLAEVEVFAAWGFGPYQGREVPPDWYVEESPMGSGISGWTDDGRAEVWLPEECSSVFKAGDVPIQVQLELKNAERGESRSSQGERRVMAETLVSYAKNLAKDMGCESGNFEITGETPEDPPFERVPDDSWCGVSGLEVLQAGAEGEKIRQRTVGDVEEDWSCVLARMGGERVHAMSAFAVTSNERFISRYKKVPERASDYFYAELFKCGSAEYLAQTSHAGVGKGNHGEHERKALEYAEADLLPAQVLHDNFVDAVKEKLGCAS